MRVTQPLRVLKGFSMIEVLVSLVIICVGVLGALVVQVHSIQLTQSTVSQSQAVLLANNLLELMRSNPDGALTDEKFSVASNYAKALGVDFNTGSTDLSSCLTRTRGAGGSGVATADIDCWLQDVSNLLPVTDAILKSSFAVCPSQSAASCDTSASSVVMIQVAWVDKTGACDNSTCTYQLRAEL